MRIHLPAALAATLCAGGAWAAHPLAHVPDAGASDGFIHTGTASYSIEAACTGCTRGSTTFSMY